MDQDSTLFKIGYNTTIQFAGKTLSALLSALSIILITRYLGVSGYGEFSLIFAYLTFFVAFTDFGLQTTIVNILSKKSFGQAQIFGTYLTLKIFLIIGAILLSLIVLFFLPYSGLVKAAIAFSSIGIGIGALGGFGNTFFQYNLRLDLTSFIDVVNRFITVILIAVFIYLKLNFFFILSSVLISNLISILLMFIFLKKIVRFRLGFDKKIAFTLLKTSFPIGLAAYLTTAYFKLDTIMLSLFRDAREVGIYSLAYKIFENLILIWTFYMASFYPFLAKFYHSQNFPKFKKLLKNSVVFGFVFSISTIFLGLLLAPFLVKVFGGSQFMESIMALRILLFAIFFACFNAILFIYLFIKNKANLILVSLALAFVFNFTLNLLIIPRFGYIGASITTVLTEVFILFSYLILITKGIVKDRGLR